MLDLKALLAKILMFCSKIGTRITVQGSSSTSSVSNSAGAYVTIGSISLPAGVWIVNLRARFVPASGTTGNTYPVIYWTSSSTGEGWHQRMMVQSTTNAAISMMAIAAPTNTTQNTTYYLRGHSNNAGSWIRQNNAQFCIDAIRIK